MLSILKFLRESKGISQRQLSTQIGISNSRLCLIERGWVNPRPCEIDRIAEALGVNLSMVGMRNIDSENSDFQEIGTKKSEDSSLK